MKGRLTDAFGYQGNAMALPVRDLAAALGFYRDVLGFHVASHTDVSPKWATLARDDVQIGLAENGGDPSQDGCAFHVTHLDALLEEFSARGLQKSDISIEKRGDEAWRVFYVVAPDGLCYWFGERQ